MISDQEMIHVITTKARGGQILYSNDQDKMQYVVDDKHEWDFKNNKYLVVKRFANNEEITEENK